MMTRISSSRNDRRNMLGINNTNSPSPWFSWGKTDLNSDEMMVEILKAEILIDVTMLSLTFTPRQ